MKKRLLGWKFYLPLLLLTVLVVCFGQVKTARAETASVVAIGKIDYDELTIQVYNNNNSLVYYSVDGDNWIELEGAYDSNTKSYTMDISWVSVKSDFTLYFKGNIVTNLVYVTLPMQDTVFSVIYDKAECDFTFNTSDDADYFEWRKASDYLWHRVNLDDESASYKAFLNTMESFMCKGAKLSFRTPQVAGTADNTGSRPSKEVAVTIVARPDAPAVSVNPSKLTVNTTSSMEYYDAGSGSWIECESTMTLDEIAPSVLSENGSHDVTLKVRKAATTSMPYSRTAYVKIKGQAAAPEIGDNTKDVTYYFVNSKLVMSFNNASETNVYEYSIVKYDDTFDATTARWTQVNNSKLITLSSSAAPYGCTVYVRKRGTAANTAKNVELILSSAVSYFLVSY